MGPVDIINLIGKTQGALVRQCAIDLIKTEKQKCKILNGNNALFAEIISQHLHRRWTLAM